MYRVGLIGWKLAARLGMPLSVRVLIHHDPEAASYWTTSPDLGGLIVSGASLEELFREVHLAVPDLVELELGKPAPRTRATYTAADAFQFA